MSGVKVSGDFAALRVLRERVESLGKPGAMMRFNRQVAEAARAEVQLGFEESRAPDGASWKPVHRGGKPLRDSGRLGNSFRVFENARGFTLRTDVEYAATHQYGATIKAKKPGQPLKFKVGARGAGGWRSKYEVKIPRRQMVPEGSLPRTWQKAFSDAARQFIREVQK